MTLITNTRIVTQYHPFLSFRGKGPTANEG